MFARNEKYGTALQLRTELAAGPRFDPVSVSRSFGLSTLMHSLRNRIRLANEEKMVVIDLGHGPVANAINFENGILGGAVNENGFAFINEKTK